MDQEKITVCMISCLHPLKDDRIYWKECISLQKHGYHVIHLGVSAYEYDEISEQGIRLISIKRKQYFRNPIIDKIFRSITLRPGIYSELFELSKKLNARVYHFHDYQINRIGKKLKDLPHKPKVIYDVHEPYPVTVASHETQNPLMKVFWRLLAITVRNLEFSSSLHYDLIITTEENVQQTFLKKLKNLPVEVIYNYCDIEPEIKVKTKIFDFIYCGGIRKRRGIFDILMAVKTLKEKGIESKTLLIGRIHDAGLEKEINHFIQINNLHENIELRKVVPYTDVHTYYELSKIGLAVFNDIKVNRIIMPIKIFEYITFRLPVITNNFGHMKRITTKYNTGLIIPYNNYISLTESMEKLLFDTELYNTYVNYCNKAAKQLRWSIMEEKLLGLYTSLLKVE